MREAQDDFNVLLKKDVAFRYEIKLTIAKRKFINFKQTKIADRKVLNLVSYDKQKV